MSSYIDILGTKVKAGDTISLKQDNKWTTGVIVSVTDDPDWINYKMQIGKGFFL